MGAKISIKVDDAQLKHALAVAPNRIINTMHRSLTRSAIQTQRYFRETLTKHHNVFTGNLRESVKYHFNNKLDVDIAPQAKYAKYVEFGSRPHFISLKKITPWANFRHLDPATVKKGIMTKGTRPHPFLKQTAKLAEKYATEDMQKQLDKAMKEIL